MKKIVLFLTVATLLAVWQIDWGQKPKECAFCEEKILKNQVFAQEKGAIGMLTYKPCAPGHVLIIPERHVERFEDLSPQEIASLGEMIKKVDTAVRKAYGNTGYLLLQKKWEGGGPICPSCPFSLPPRYPIFDPPLFPCPLAKAVKREGAHGLERDSSKSRTMD